MWIPNPTLTGKKSHKPELNDACFIRRLSKAEDPKLQCYLKKIFSVHPSVQHPSSHGSHVQKIPQCLPQMPSLFHVGITVLFFLTVYSIQVSGSHKYIEFSAALWFKVCLMRCLEMWLSFQISRGKMSVCRIFEGPLFKIQFDWPKSLLWQHPAFSLIPTSTVGLPSQLWLFTLKQRDTFPSGSAS